MYNFKLVSIKTIEDRLDEYTYELRTSNCIVKLVAKVDFKCGAVLLNIIQTLGFVYEEEKVAVLKAIYKMIEQFEDLVGKDYNLFLDPDGECNLFVQHLDKLGLLAYINKDRQNYLREVYDLLDEMIDVDAIIEATRREIEIVILDGMSPEQIEEQNELLKEANQKYIDGLNDALTKE